MKARYDLRRLLMLALLPLIASGCSKVEDDENVKKPDEDDKIDTSKFKNAVVIKYGDDVEVTSPFSSDSVSLAISGNQVVVNSISEDVEFVLTGSSVDGSFKIYSDNEFKLSLYDVTLKSSLGPAVNIQSKKRCYVDLEENSSSLLSDGTSYTTVSNEDMKGCLFSEGALVFGGEGILTVKGNYKHGICSDEYIRYNSGNLVVESINSDAIHTNGAIIIDGGQIMLTSGSDGIESEKGYFELTDGSIVINSLNEGIKTSYDGTSSSIDPYVKISGGKINIATDAISAKGIKSMGDITIDDGEIYVTTSQSDSDGIESKKNLVINGGVIEVIANGDAIKGKGSVTITEGKVYCYSELNDGVDTDGTITISGGVVVSVGGSSPEKGFDCDKNTFAITGGTVVGIGGATSLPTSSACGQPTIIYATALKQNALMNIRDEAGNDLLCVKIPRVLNPGSVLISSSLLNSGATYGIYTDGNISSGDGFNGLYINPDYSPGTLLQLVVLEDMVTNM